MPCWAHNDYMCVWAWAAFLSVCWRRNTRTFFPLSWILFSSRKFLDPYSICWYVEAVWSRGSYFLCSWAFVKGRNLNSQGQKKNKNSTFHFKCDDWCSVFFSLKKDKCLQRFCKKPQLFPKWSEKIQDSRLFIPHIHSYNEQWNVALIQLWDWNIVTMN